MLVVLVIVASIIYLVFVIGAEVIALLYPQLISGKEAKNAKGRKTSRQLKLEHQRSRRRSTLRAVVHNPMMASASKVVTRHDLADEEETTKRKKAFLAQLGENNRKLKKELQD